MQDYPQQVKIKDKREHWLSHSEAWQASGQTQGEYCKQHGLNLKTFAYWRRRFKSDSTALSALRYRVEHLRDDP